MITLKTILALTITGLLPLTALADESIANIIAKNYQRDIVIDNMILVAKTCGRPKVISRALNKKANASPPSCASDKSAKPGSGKGPY